MRLQKVVELKALAVLGRIHGAFVQGPAMLLQKQNEITMQARAPREGRRRHVRHNHITYAAVTLRPWNVRLEHQKHGAVRGLVNGGKVRIHNHRRVECPHSKPLR